MGIRSERITGKAIAEQAGQLIGQTLQVVTWTGLTYFGRVIRADAQTLDIRDPNAYWYNRKRHTHQIDLVDIREIVRDLPSKW